VRIGINKFPLSNKKEALFTFSLNELPNKGIPLRSIEPFAPFSPRLNILRKSLRNNKNPINIITKNIMNIIRTVTHGGTLERKI